MPKERAGGRKEAKAKVPAALVVGAAQKADLAQLEALVARGGDVNASWRNYRPLHALIQVEPHAARAPVTAERLACLDWLLAHGADPDALGAWPSARAVLVAAFTGAPELVARLRKAGARADLFLAAALGEVAAVRKELARDRTRAGARDATGLGPKAAPDEGLTPLQCCAGSRLGQGEPAVAKRLREIATLLLDAGADPNARVRSWGHAVDAAYFAIGAQHLELLELLLERGAEPHSALVTAAWKEDKRFAEAALRRGAEPDRARENGRPILNELVRWGQVAPALWLLARGASPNAPDERGWTALHQAATRGNERLFRALLEADGDARRANAEGHSPLDLVAAKGNKKLLALLTGGAPPPGKRKAARAKS